MVRRRILVPCRRQDPTLDRLANFEITSGFKKTSLLLLTVHNSIKVIDSFYFALILTPRAANFRG
jgi:hypothetical protein